ncbi:hypothetical protein M2322_002429 [Rhodoblastus acidophilus]|nr:hypothetical protein [Rhodoblastus acidophilus]MCW2316875.1 hypothetical protein [Rhodoblastus acidophilus]
MIAPLDDMDGVRSHHALTDALKQIQRAEPVLRSLDEKNRRAKRKKNCVAQIRSISCAAKRLSEADDRLDAFGQGDVATDPTAHTLADQHNRPGMVFPQSRQGRPMPFHELRKTIGAFPAFKRVGIIEGDDGPDRLQHFAKGLHARMSRRRAGAGRKQEGDVWFGHDLSLPTLRWLIMPWPVTGAQIIMLRGARFERRLR